MGGKDTKTRIVMDTANRDEDAGKLPVVGRRSVQVRKAATAETKDLPINDKIGDHAVATLPSVHTMLHNAYAIIDMELRRLGRRSQIGGLDRGETNQFEKYAQSLAKLVKMEAAVRDNSSLDAMSDKELTEQVLKKLKESMDG